jgi:hypothetical protein
VAVKTVQLILPELHPMQRAIKSQATRFNVLSCGRRFGKDVLGHELAVDTLIDDCAPVAWFAPTYRMMLDTFKDMRNILQPITTAVNASDHRIEVVTGGVMDFWSLDGETVRGRRYKRAIVNEAAMVADLMRKWNEAVRPTLADFVGDAWFLSTPRGRDGFWSLFQQGATGRQDWRAWQYRTWDNPHIKRSEIEAMRRDMTERAYLQEVEAQFIEDAGLVFRRVRDCATAQRQTEPVQGHAYIFGVDWGKSNDYTVISVLDETTKALVFADRFNQIDYAVQRGRLKALYDRFHPSYIIAESNSIGEPIIEQLRRDGLRVRPFNTTNATKTEAIEALALAFEQGSISIIPDETLINELQAYELERLPSGAIRYGAPAGAHDDMVMSLAIAWSNTIKRAGYGFGG